MKKWLSLLLLSSLVFLPCVYATDYTQDDAECQAAWKMDVDEDPLTDSTGNGYTAALKGASEPNYDASGKYGGCYVGDGGNDYCLINGDPVPAADEQLTFVVWLKPDVTTATDAIYGTRDSGGNGGWMVALRGADTGDPIRFTIFGVADIDSNASGIGTSTFYHVGVTYDKSNVRFYVNGVAKGAPSQSGNIAASDVDPMFFALNNGGSASNAFDGREDDLGVFNNDKNSTIINDIMDHGLDGTQGAAVYAAQVI